MPSNEYIAGIDIGSTNIKCVIYDTAGHAAGMAVRATSNACDWMPGLRYAYLSAESLWRLTAQCCAEAVMGLVKPFEIKGIAVASMGCSAIFLDARDQQVAIDLPRESLIEVFQSWHSRSDAGQHFRETGYPLDSMSTECYIAACAAEKPDEFERISKVLSVADYISYRLSGTYTREFSTAGSMGLMNVETRKWRRDFLASVGLNEKALGTPVYGGEYIGKVTASAATETNMAPGTPVFTGGHDYLCSAFACDAGADSILNVTGTVEIVSVFTREPQCHAHDGKNRFIIDHCVTPGCYSLMTEATGAGHIEWFIKSFYGKGKKFIAREWQMDHRGPPAVGYKPLFVPRNFGTMPQSENGDSGGAFLFLSEDTGKKALMRAVVEGMAYQTKKMLETIKRVTKAERFLQVGGGARQRSWTQLKADVLGIPVYVPAVTESTALGAALLAGVGCGVYRNYEEAAHIPFALGGDTYEPDQRSADAYEQIYREVFLPAANDLKRREAALHEIEDNGGRQ